MSARTDAPSTPSSRYVPGEASDDDRSATRAPLPLDRSRVHAGTTSIPVPNRPARHARDTRGRRLLGARLRKADRDRAKVDRGSALLLLARSRALLAGARASSPL